jgi:beta-N-acetylhexosaminidase
VRPVPNSSNPNSPFSATRRQFLSSAGAAAAGIAATGIPTPAFADDTEKVAWVHRTISRMTLEEKVGQLFMTYAYGNDATNVTSADRSANRAAYGVDTPQAVIDKYALGGLIYFSWSNNLQNPSQIAVLSNGAQRASLERASRAPTPLLISTDQEHGVVLRLGPPVTMFPGAMSLGAGRDPAVAYRAAEITGTELRAMGVNQNLAPVADVNVNALNPVIGVRSYGSDPSLCSQLTAAQVAGFQRGAGLVATAKHFPGHGDTDTDSHTGIPIIDHTVTEWQQIDAPPFQAAIRAGTDMIMTAHILVPSLDPAMDPATLSRPILTGVLRGQLGFTGVIITDSLGMAGVRQKYGDDRVPVLALQAGADMLLMPPLMDVAYQSVLNAVRSGEITEERVEESLRRILAVKWDRGLVDDPYAKPERIPARVGIPEHLAAAQTAAERAITLVRDDSRFLPMSAAARSVLVTGYHNSTFDSIGEFAAALTARGATVTRKPYGTRPTDTQIADAVAAAANHDLTVVFTNKAWDTRVTDPNAKQQKLVKSLLATGQQVVVVAVRDPYDIAYFTEAPIYLVTYAYNAPLMHALARLMYGEVSPVGKLPVMIPVSWDPNLALYPYGHGMTW